MKSSISLFLSKKSSEPSDNRVGIERTLAVDSDENGGVGLVVDEIVAAVDDVTLLAAIIQCEAGGDIYESQLGVGAVVINRVKSGAYPNSISEVIYQRGQFGPASSGKLASVLASGNISGTAYQAATDAINGVDNTGGCLGCRGASSGHAGTVIGAMVFY